MHTFIKMVGAIIATLGILVAVVAVFTAERSPMGQQSQLYALLLGAGVALPGATLYCFGAIVEHLIAIRKNTERQVEIFERLGNSKV